MEKSLNNDFVNRLVQDVHAQASLLFKDSLNNVILFGSYARGNYDEYSDIDFMLVVNLSSVQLSGYRKEIAKVASKLSLQYDLTVSLHLQDSHTIARYGDVLPYFKNVMEEGIFTNAG